MTTTNDDFTLQLTLSEARILEAMLHRAYDEPALFGAYPDGAYDGEERTRIGEVQNIFTASVWRMLKKLRKVPPVPEKTLVHYVVIYSRRLGRALMEKQCDSGSAAFELKMTTMADKKWRGRSDVDIVTVSGPSREELARTHPHYFAGRPRRRA
jgi:hypothetical protein